MDGPIRKTSKIPPWLSLEYQCSHHDGQAFNLQLIFFMQTKLSNIVNKRKLSIYYDGDWIQKRFVIKKVKPRLSFHPVHQKLVTNSGIEQWLFAIVRKSYLTLTTQMRGLRRYQVVGGAKESKWAVAMDPLEELPPLNNEKAQFTGAVLRAGHTSRFFIKTWLIWLAHP